MITMPLVVSAFHYHWEVQIEVQDQVEIWRPHFWPYFLNYTFFKKIFHSECNPRDTSNEWV